LAGFAPVMGHSSGFCELEITSSEAEYRGEVSPGDGRRGCFEALADNINVGTADIYQ
jgi:hypothetical protein